MLAHCAHVVRKPEVGWNSPREKVDKEGGRQVM